MGIAGEFLRAAIGGPVFGACCRNLPGPGGVSQFECTPRSKPDCFNAQEENPDPANIFFYPNLGCNEVACGTIACCLEDGCQHTPWIPPGGPVDPFDPDCVSLGGDPQRRGTQCSQRPCDVPDPPEERPEGCLTEPRARPRAPGGFVWTEDLCAAAQFRMTIRPPHEWPTRQQDHKFVALNYAEMVSVGAIRANETDSGIEPCRRHYAKIVITKTGYARMMMCGQHVLGDPKSLQVSEGRFYIENDSVRPKPRLSDRIDNGYAAVAVAYRTPYFVEAIYHAAQTFCREIP